ncbi:odorant receptor 46a-like [Belonocnema kinseyi]|uniref:odorant receptor 46a-like n=1 Tax=Belonocnema kinseyi TaxID=2817044 RepID=UPI00143CF2DF|nr:odorant receptor 46a-like [Belonocnema kinseyi]
MDTLPRQFTALWFCGLWEESSIKFSLKRKFYRIVVLTLIYAFTLSEIIQFSLTCESLENFVEIYPSLTYIVFCWKVLNFIRKESAMRQMLSNFQESSFKPRTTEEFIILDKYLNKSQLICKYITSVLLLCGISIVLTPLLKWGEGVELPFNLYYPFEVTKPTVFVITYVFQSALNTFSIFINITLDTTVYGFLLLTIGQFELFAFRLEKVSADEKLIKEFVKHHVRILRLVKQIESFFMIAILPFFMCSLLILCTIIFQIAQEENTLNGNWFQFFTLVQYVICVLSQIFLYCWYGCRVDEKSKDVASAIYYSNWVFSTHADRKSLSLMMINADGGSPISFRSLCSLNLQTFGWVIKTSYAAVNLLKQAAVA